MIRNPILPGFNPDPCICRKGEDYYLAVGMDCRRMASDGRREQSCKSGSTRESACGSPMPKIPDFDDFDEEELGNYYYAPRIMPHHFADLKARPGYVRLRGRNPVLH